MSAKVGSLADQGQGFRASHLARAESPRSDRPQAQNIRIFREFEGSAIGASARQTVREDELLPDEKELLSILSEEGRKGNWKKVAAAWASYGGYAQPVYGAAMQAAIRCRRYEEAAEMYDRLANASIEPNAICLYMGIKTFGKLQSRSRVQELWDDAQGRGLVNKIIAGARIDAAAEVGDFRDAATMLEYMATANLPLELPVWNSAINACKNADPPNSTAALSFFDELRGQTLSPNIVTFTNLVGAHKEAPLHEISELRAKMSSFGVNPNKVFAETYLGTVLKGRLQNVQTVKDVANRLLEIKDERLQEARVALTQFKAANIRLSKLCKLLDEYLRLSRG